jgi:glycosyltransferase involved in cell wall biosynthesis
MAYDLSVIIPARNEQFLGETIADILEHIEGNTEVIAVLDGTWPVKPIPDNPRLTLIQHFQSVGQRAAANEAARLSNAKYIMKVDAHCSFDQGFDMKMMSKMEDDITMIPIMRNLHAFDWVCPNGHRRYQSPSGPCVECGAPTTMDILWHAKKRPASTCYRFDTDMHFQYWSERGKQLEGDLTETMSIQGSCFLVTRQKYFDLDLCSESFYSWGQQGVEVACKTWLSGGRVLVNRTTWYAHMFRTQGGDFGFPYENDFLEVAKNRKKSKELFAENKWPHAIHSFDWLIDKFNPPDWRTMV